MVPAQQYVGAIPSDLQGVPAEPEAWQLLDRPSHGGAAIRPQGCKLIMRAVGGGSVLSLRSDAYEVCTAPSSHKARPLRIARQQSSLWLDHNRMRAGRAYSGREAGRTEAIASKGAGHGTTAPSLFFPRQSNFVLVRHAGRVGSRAQRWSWSAAGPGTPPSQWRLSFTPYAWLTWLDGEQTVRGRSVDVKVDPIQVLGHLERVPFFGYGEARNGRLVVYTDVFYANLGLSGDGIRSRSLAPGINGTLSAAFGLDFEETVFEVGAPTRS